MMEENARSFALGIEKSDKMFRALIESTHAMVVIASLKEYRSVYANPAATEITGYSFEELTASPPLDLFSEDSKKKRDEYMAAYLRGEQLPQRAEMEIVTKDGQYRWIETSWAILDMGDEGIYKVTTSFDITERKKAESALKESEKKFRTLADSTTASIGITQCDSFIYANQTLLDSIGMTWEQFSKENPTDSLSQSAIAAGKIAKKEAKARGETTYRFEYETDDNKWREVTASPTEINGKESWIWTSFDVTEHKLVQQELEAGEERYRTIFDTAGTAMISFTDDSVITMANDEWIDLSGFSKEETIGKLTWIPFFTQDSLSKMKRYHEIRAKDPSAAPNAYEAHFIDRQGRIHNGVVNIQVIPGTHQRIASFQDMTQLKRAQNEMYRADKMAALGQIIAGVAHEINNPNNFIYFNLPILRRYIDAIRPMMDHHLKDDPDLKILNMPYEAFLEDVFKLLENMEHGSARITGIVSELKNYIRSDEEIELKQVSIEAVVNQVMVLVGKQVRKMVKQFDVDIAQGLPWIKINSGKIEQVLINLVINAGQAADKKNAWVKVAVNLADDSDFVEITVKDNGAGIPEQNLEQIFEPFFTSKSRETGTGLGLSISHRIIEEHGGTINVSSKLGEGTCFTIHLPVNNI